MRWQVSRHYPVFHSFFYLKKINFSPVLHSLPSYHNIRSNHTSKMKGPPSAFLDIGANLLDEMFQGRYNGKDAPYHPADLDTVLHRAWDSGVCKIIITAGNLEEARAALALARTDGKIFFLSFNIIIRIYELTFTE